MFLCCSILACPSDDLFDRYRLAKAAGASVSVLPLAGADSLIRSPPKQRQAEAADSFSLFVYPLESNLTGAKYPRDWPALIRSHPPSFPAAVPTDGPTAGRSTRWLVFADAAKAAATGPIDMKALGADFLCVSFYKLCGWPDGLGALIIKNGMCFLRPFRSFYLTSSLFFRNHALRGLRAMSH